ncbi:MAG TPA: hypothetical protein P5227_07450, partial [Emcibacteraceae bacterium]|nr:hypothetical protein [Emcibacteraceae bacterium]
FEKACREGHAWGCTGLAEAYSDGIGVRADRTQALSAARSGCLESEGNTVPACSRYGYLLIRNGPQRNMSLGIKLLVKACLASDAFACNEVGEVGWKRPLGTGITAWEVPLYFRDGCDLNNADACFNLASIYEIGFDQLAEHQSPMLSLLEKACSLGSAEACDKIKSMGRAVELMRKRPPKVDPSKTALQQLAIAVEFAEQKKYAIALDAVVRLMHEGVPEASWVLGGWFYYGYPGMINEPRISDGIILIENAARLRHVEAAKWISMAYWYGDNVAEDREKGQQYMAFAAQSGDPEARDIYRSMLAEPIRQERARREREMAEEAERRKHDWGYQISLARAGWLQAQQGSSYGTGNSAAASASWQRSQSALDKLNWNNAVGYATGRTTACPISNPYC